MRNRRKAVEQKNGGLKNEIRKRKMRKRMNVREGAKENDG